MFRGILLVAIAGVLTGACGRRAGSLPLPAQQSVDLGPDPGGLRGMVKMDDPDAGAFLVRDISPAPGVTRWAFRQPELRFRVKDVRNLKFAVEFAIPDVTFRVTGPVVVSCAINGKTLAVLRCDHAGDYRLQHAVPQGLVEPGQLIHVSFEANPRWVSPDDGAQLSFLLRSAGFTQ